MWYLYLSEPPLSHFDTDCRDTPSLSASSSCDHPFCFLSINIFSDNVITAPPVILFLPSAPAGSVNARISEIYFRNFRATLTISDSSRQFYQPEFENAEPGGNRRLRIEFSHILTVRRFSRRYRSGSISHNGERSGQCTHLCRDKPDDGRSRCPPPAE